MAEREALVHAIVGDGKTGFDSYRAEQELKRLLEAFLGPGGDVEWLRGDEVSWVRVLDSARTPSLFSPRRALVVRGAEALKGEPEGVQEYLDDPTPNVLLVLVAEKPDGRKAAWKTVLKKARVTNVPPLKGRALRAYVTEELSRRKLPLQDVAVDELVLRFGQDLRRLLGELDKIAAFWDKKSPLSAEAVADLCGRGFAPPLYRLTDALLQRRAGEVLSMTEEVLQEGEPGPLVLGALFRALRQLRVVKGLGAGRNVRQEVVSRLRIPPFKLDEILSAARNFSEEDLQKATLALYQADRQVKTGTDARVALSSAIAEACRPR